MATHSGFVPLRLPWLYRVASDGTLPKQRQAVTRMLIFGRKCCLGVNVKTLFYLAILTKRSNRERTPPESLSLSFSWFVHAMDGVALVEGYENVPLHMLFWCLNVGWR
jgi:hypothetical protein